jgi:Rieske 2Fe-2S family protein
MSPFRNTADSFQPETKSLSGEFYFDEAIFNLEREKIFAEGWICVGREEEIPDPGTFLLAEVAGENLVVIRSDRNRVSAFYNVCRHRGSRLCLAPQGRLGERIRCPYHGWTYDLEGALKFAPHMDEVSGFDGAAFGLHRIKAATSSGLVFVNLADEAKPFDGEVTRHLAKFGTWALPDLRVRKRIDYDVAANWKLIVENYSECYHCPLVHPAFSRLVHHRSGSNDAYSGPMLGGYMELTRGASSLTATGARCGPVLGGVSGADLARVYFYALFPNLMVSLHPDYVMTHILQPLAPNRTSVRCEWLFPERTGDGERCEPEAAVAFWDPTNREDWEVCAGVQQGVGSRAYRPSPLSSAESLPQAFNQQLLGALGLDDPTRPDVRNGFHRTDRSSRR